MKEDIKLKAEKRQPSTKGAIGTLRRQGRVPAVAYGDKQAPIPLSVDEKSLQMILKSERGRNALVSLEVEGSSHAVLLKEIQRDPITRAISHVDLYRVSLKKKVETAVPIHVKGEAPGVKLSGGILEHIVREIRVRCLPTEIPASLDVEVSALQIGMSIKAKDLTAPSGVELLLDPEAVVVNVVAPTVLEEPTPAAAAAATAGAAPAEPEVIKKGKTEEGEAGAAAPAAGDKKAAAAAPAKPEAKK